MNADEYEHQMRRAIADAQREWAIRAWRIARPGGWAVGKATRGKATSRMAAPAAPLADTGRIAAMKRIATSNPTIGSNTPMADPETRSRALDELARLAYSCAQPGEQANGRALGRSGGSGRRRLERREEPA